MSGFYPDLPDGWVYTLRISTIYWICGHVTDHGPNEKPMRCPVCWGDRLRLCWTGDAECLKS